MDPCSTHLDDPVLILGLEPEDYGLVMLMLILTSTVANVLFAFASAAGIGVAFWVLKRGQPPGTLIHTLHRARQAGFEILDPPGQLARVNSSPLSIARL